MLADDQLVIGFSASWELKYFDMEGNLTRISRRQAEPVPVTRADRAEYEKRMEGAGGGLSISTESMGSVYPEAHPVFTNAIADREGNIWLEENHKGSNSLQRWVVFDRQGRWLTTVALPDNFRPADIGSDYVLGISQDDMGVHHVHLYDLIKP